MRITAKAIRETRAEAQAKGLRDGVGAFKAGLPPKSYPDHYRQIPDEYKQQLLDAKEQGLKDGFDKGYEQERQIVNRAWHKL
jgi:hypothetical protein